MKVMITGGSGFIGYYVCRECEKRNLDYCVLSNEEVSLIPANNAIANIVKYEEVYSAISCFRPDAIIHLAAISSPVHNNIGEIYTTNVCGTENVLKAASLLNNNCKIILTSTAGVYGNQDVKLLTEDLNYNPINHYSYSKMVTEIMSRQYSNQLDITIVRPFNIVGLGQSDKFLIPKLVNHFINKRETIALGNLTPIRDYVSVEYCARVMVDLATKRDSKIEIINICSGTGFSCADVIAMLEELTHFSPRIVSNSEFIRSNEIWSLVGNPQRINSFVNGEYCSTDLRSILSSMLN